MPASPVSLEFVPLYLLGSEQPNPTATGPGFAVPAVQTSDGTGRLAFKPPDVEPGRLFRVTPKTDDGDCAPDGAAAYWLPGSALQLQTRIKSETTLEVCLPGDVTPCEYPEVKGVFIHRGDLPSSPDEAASSVAVSGWGIEKTFWAEDLKKQKQRFRSTTNLAVAGSGKLQASVLPFPKGAEGDPSTVPGLVASWDVACVNCEFTVDLSPLAPPSPPAKKHWYKSVFDGVAKPFKLAGKGVSNMFGKAGDLVGLGGGDKKSSNEVVKAGKPQLPNTKPGDYLVAGAKNPLLQPTTYYFRLLVPLKSAPDSNAATNAVRMQQVDKPPEFKIPNPTATPIPTESPYEVSVAAYHGIVPPLNSNKVCYVATQDAWPKTFMAPIVYTTKKSEAYVTGTSLDVHAGDLICQPDPHEPDIFEAILSWAEYVVDWTSQAWSDIKDFAVDVVLKYTPLGALCTSVAKKDTCTSAFNMALDAVLLAAGIPPDIPNFHELLDQGIDYVAAQAAAQVGIPPEVIKAATDAGGTYAGWAADAAEAELRKELQAQIKAKLGNAAKAIELGNAANVSWVPDGIPVRLDDFLPPAMTVIVKRKPGVPGGDDGCSLKISDTVNVSKETLDSPPPGYEWIKSLPHELSHLTSYDLFADEAGSGVDKSLSVPPLAEGESFTIPMTFKPNYYKSGWSPNGLIPTSQYISVWYFLHETGHAASIRAGFLWLDQARRAGESGAVRRAGGAVAMDVHLGVALSRAPVVHPTREPIASNSDARRAARRAAIIFGLIAVIAAAGWQASGRANNGIDAAVTRGVIDRTNLARTESGRLPLEANPHLTRAAETYAREMAQNGRFDHTARDGAGVDARAEAAGYTNWEYLAENLATGAGRPDAGAVVDRWLESPDHRRNILAPELRDTGVACYVVGGLYWCAQEFGTRIP